MATLIIEGLPAPEAQRHASGWGLNSRTANGLESMGHQNANTQKDESSHYRRQHRPILMPSPSQADQYPHSQNYSQISEKFPAVAEFQQQVTPASAVPELRRSATIKLNALLSLRRDLNSIACRTGDHRSDWRDIGRRARHLAGIWLLDLEGRS